METLLPSIVVLERDLRITKSRGTSALSVIAATASRNEAMIGTIETTVEQKSKELDDFKSTNFSSRIDVAQNKSDWLDLASASLFRKYSDRIFLIAKHPVNGNVSLTLVQPQDGFSNLMGNFSVVSQSQSESTPISYSNTGTITVLNGNVKRQFRVRVRTAFTTNQNYNNSGSSRIGFEIRLNVDFSVPINTKKIFNESGNPIFYGGGNTIIDEEYIITTSHSQSTVTFHPQIRIPDAVQGLASYAQFTRLSRGYYCQYNEFSVEELLEL